MAEPTERPRLNLKPRDPAAAKKAEAERAAKVSSGHRGRGTPGGPSGMRAGPEAARLGPRRRWRPGGPLRAP